MELHLAVSEAIKYKPEDFNELDGTYFKFKQKQ